MRIANRAAFFLLKTNTSRCVESVVTVLIPFYNFIRQRRLPERWKNNARMEIEEETERDREKGREDQTSSVRFNSSSHLH